MTYPYRYTANILKWLDTNTVAVEIDLGFHKWQLVVLTVEHEVEQFLPRTPVIIDVRMEKHGRDDYRYSCRLYEVGSQVPEMGYREVPTLRSEAHVS